MSDRPQQSQQLKDLLKEWYNYGLFAHCAYADSKDAAQGFLDQVPVPSDLQQTFNDLLKSNAIHLHKYESLLKTGVPTDTEVVLAKVESPGGGHELVMAFRGTEATFIDPETGKVADDGKVTFLPTADLIFDAATDLDFEWTPVTDISGLREGKAAELDLADCEVHNGFLSSFNDVVNGNNLDSKQDSALEEAVRVKQLFPIGEKPPVRIVCCGHSLGAALCTLAAFWCKATNFLGVEDVKCFAFASPRVGNKAFVNSFNMLVGQSSCYRFTHKDDIVPALPLEDMGFYHVNRPVFLLQPGQNDYGVYDEMPKLDPSAYDVVMTARPKIDAWEVARLLRHLDQAPHIVTDHYMPKYLEALANVMQQHTGLQLPRPKVAAGDVQHKVDQNKDVVDADALEFAYKAALSALLRALATKKEATGSVTAAK